jgi:TonB-dependent starch-binding outer membrane protein SusC
MEFEVLCSTPPGATSKLIFSLRKTLLLMKMLTLFTVVACLQAWSNGYTQTITLSLKNAPLEKVFKEIRKQTAYSFIYTKEEVDAARPVTIQVKAATIDYVLNICLKDQPLSYTIEEDHIVIRKQEEKISPEKETEIQLIDVRGRVVNETGEPLEGITVLVKTTNKGTSTNANGEFLLPGLSETAILVFSGSNVEGSEIRINGRSFIEAHLKTKNSKLDEIQVIAYGTNTQRYNVGSVSKITAEEISRQPVSNPLLAMQGRIPGLTVTSTSGLPGAAIKIQIRGQNNLSPTANPTIAPIDNPFFIIDGIPFAPQNTNINQFPSAISPTFISRVYNNSFTGISPFSSINPSDIESIEVLRDADATAIYGSRGANGVVIITTKKATAGKTGFNLNFYQGISSEPKTMQVMNTDQYVNMRKQAIANDGSSPNLNSGSPGYAPDLLVFDSTRNKKWREYFTGGSARVSDMNASLSGGTANTQFLVSSGFHRETYIYPGDFSSNLVSFNSSLSHHSPEKKFSLLLSTNYSFYRNNSTGSADMLAVSQLEPNFPELADTQGNLLWQYKGIVFGTGNGVSSNPLAFAMIKYNITTYNLISNLKLEYNILHGLILRSSFGYNTLNSNEYSASPASSFNPSLNVQSSASFGTNNIRSWIVEPQMEYNKSFHKAKVNLLFGTTFQQNTTNITRISASGYINEALLNSISAASTKTVADGNSAYKYDAIFMRANYNFNNKYIINATGRRDGSSRFGPEKKFGNFGAIGGGWIFSQEPYIKKNLKIVSYGKLRASYGVTGSDAVGDYQYIARWASTTYTYQGSLGYLPQNLGNSQFSWALTKKLEAGLELGFLQDRLLLNLAWYRNRSGNQLVSYPLSSQTGFPTVTENWEALVENKGAEIAINFNAINNKVFTWSISLNASIPKNKLVSFPGIENSAYVYQYIVGQSVNALRRFVYRGVNDTTGVYEFEAANKTITSKPNNSTDLKVIGNLDPKFFGGFGNSLSYKGIILDFFLEFRKQVGANFLQQIYLSGKYPGYEANQPVEFLSSWQKPGDKSLYEKFTVRSSSAAGQAAGYFANSSGSYSDASYIRFKSISISYSLPKSFLSKIKMSTCRFYINAQNLFTISNYRGNDPETQNYFGIPPLRTIASGIQLTF